MKRNRKKWVFFQQNSYKYMFNQSNQIKIKVKNWNLRFFLKFRDAALTDADLRPRSITALQTEPPSSSSLPPPRPLLHRADDEGPLQTFPASDSLLWSGAPLLIIRRLGGVRGQDRVWTLRRSGNPTHLPPLLTAPSFQFCHFSDSPKETPQNLLVI